ncbi:hypothetical protein F0562_000381 [Nyssa sinensis]|uniref:Calcium-transporting ATPase n=1 Tax=Nyssa sinensis TaxID=561372 RepID=A0A5J5C443_9ASTE|nr:hypothetical protein F0562_000381 [Nyssa sinensis]
MFLSELLAKKRKYVRNRWRLAITKVLLSRAKKTIEPSRRLHLVSTIISCTRVLDSLAQEIAAEKVKQLRDAVQRSQSFLAIDISPSDGPINIDQESLTAVIKEKNMERLRGDFGGVEGVIKALQTHAEDGVQGDAEDLRHRCKVFGSNTYPKFLVYIKWFYLYLLKSFNVINLYSLLAFAAIFIGVQIKTCGWKYGWENSGMILSVTLAVSIASVIFGFAVEYYLQTSFEIRNNFFSTLVDVVRNGHKQQISVSKIVVGDVVCLNMGDQVPADGLFLGGQSLKVDESVFTGGSELEVNCNTNPFLFSGTKVIGGRAKMVVTMVGQKTKWAEKMSSRRYVDREKTALEARIKKLKSSALKVGLTVAIIGLVFLLARYFLGGTKDDKGNREFIVGKKNALDLLCAIAKIILFFAAIAYNMEAPGFLWIVKITLAYSIRQMMDIDKVWVRNLSACETMGSVTTIVTDTLNQLKVTKFWLGQESTEDGVSSSIAPNVLELIKGVGLNTNASVYRSTASPNFDLSGVPIEKAIIHWAVLKLKVNLGELQDSSIILAVEPFTSEKQRSGVLMRKKADNTTHVHWKGAAEMILPMCSSYYDTSGNLQVLDDGERMKFEHIIQGMSSSESNHQFVAFAHAQVTEEDCSSDEKIKENCLTLLGMVCLKGPCQSEVKKSVEACLNAGVRIIMIASDDISTASAKAIECGMLMPNHGMNSGAVMEGEEFKNYTIQENGIETTDELRVVARASAQDRLLMVKWLKEKGHVVAETGDDTNDAPALKKADVRLSIGIQGTEIIGKEKVDIVILDNNFASMAMILRWGRCVLNNTQKLIQFQLAANVVFLANNFIEVVSVSGIIMLRNSLAYALVDFIWVNLVWGMFAAFALGMERPGRELIQKPPLPHSQPLITNIMWRNIMAQVVYQVAIAQTVQFQGQFLFGVHDGVVDTMSFVTSNLCLLFNLFNARKLEKKNIFEGIHKNKCFTVIVGIIICLQVAMIEFIASFFEMERLNWEQWMICIGLAFASWPVGLVGINLPDEHKHVSDLLPIMDLLYIFMFESLNNFLCSTQKETLSSKSRDLKGKQTLLQ